MVRPTSLDSSTRTRRTCGRVGAAALGALLVSAFLIAPAQAKDDGGTPSLRKGEFVAEALDAEVLVFDAPGAAAPTHRFANPTATDGELVFLVEEIRTDGWFEVLLPIRPNGSKGWVKSSDVSLVFNPYRIVVRLGAHRLTVFKGRKKVQTEQVGIGKANTPTPGGRYYITQLFKPPDPGGPYGPYAYSLSGFSEVLTTFRGGDAIVGIHGTNKPELIGEDVSSGCIRMRNDAIERLAKILPLGTPVEIKK